MRLLTDTTDAIDVNYLCELRGETVFTACGCVILLRVDKGVARKFRNAILEGAVNIVIHSFPKVRL